MTKIRPINGQKWWFFSTSCFPACKFKKDHGEKAPLLTWPIQNKVLTKRPLQKGAHSKKDTSKKDIYKKVNFQKDIYLKDNLPKRPFI